MLLFLFEKVYLLVYLTHSQCLQTMLVIYYQRVRVNVVFNLKCLYEWKWYQCYKILQSGRFFLITLKLIFFIDGNYFIFNQIIIYWCYCLVMSCICWMRVLNMNPATISFFRVSTIIMQCKMSKVVHL